MLFRALGSVGGITSLNSKSTSLLAMSADFKGGCLVPDLEAIYFAVERRVRRAVGSILAMAGSGAWGVVELKPSRKSGLGLHEYVYATEMRLSLKTIIKVPGG